MIELKKLSLKEEVDRDAKEIEKEIRSRDDLDDIIVSEDMETSLFEKIQEYEYDKRYKKKVRHMRKRRRLFLALAAAVILVFGSVMTGTGSKSYWKVLWDRVAGEENANLINVENMESQETKDIDEIQVFNQIRRELGIYPVRFGYIPRGMSLKEFEIDDAQENAVLLYSYENRTIKYSMYMNDKDSSQGQIEPDELIREYKVSVSGNVSVSVKEYEVDGSDENRYTADFEYMDAQYEIKGAMEKGEFEKILKNMIFYDENA